MALDDVAVWGVARTKAVDKIPLVVLIREISVFLIFDIPFMIEDLPAAAHNTQVHQPFGAVYFNAGSVNTPVRKLFPEAYIGLGFVHVTAENPAFEAHRKIFVVVGHCLHIRDVPFVVVQYPASCAVNRLRIVRIANNHARQIDHVVGHGHLQTRRIFPPVVGRLVTAYGIWNLVGRAKPHVPV